MRAVACGGGAAASACRLLSLDADHRRAGVRRRNDHLGERCFVGYELLGFSGLGPGRLELRSAGPAALRGYWAWLALYAVAIAIVIGAALLHEVRRQESPASGCWRSAAACLPAFILGVGCVAHFRVLGRHFAPFVPVLLLLFASGLCVLWSRRSAWARGVVLLFAA